MSEDFLRRWARLKRASSASPTEAPVERKEDPPVALPPLDSLNFDSDFKAFMHSKVEEGVKRAALKKLFSDPRFNVMDGLDTYVDDYSKEDPISEELLAQLNHARTTLFGPPKEAQAQPAEEKEGAQVADEGQAAKTDADPAQDPKAL